MKPTHPGRAAISLASKLAWPASVLFVLGGITFTLLRAWHDHFDADELQHAHIAWLVANGKVIYRDFWEHHGPLFALANGALLRLSGATADFDLLFWCRGSSLLATVGILVCTYSIARLLALTPAVSLAAVGITLSLFFVQDKAPQCRPDTWQNFFWYVGLALVIANVVRRSLIRSMLAGALLGLAVMTNAKAAFGPVFIFLYYVFGWRVHGLTPRQVLTDLLAIGAGTAFVCLIVIGYLGLRDAALQFYTSSVVFNAVLADEMTRTPVAREQVTFMLTWQLPFVIAVAVGAIAAADRLRNQRCDATSVRWWLTLAVSAGTGIGWAIHQYPQFYLLLLPLWSIVAAHGVAAAAGGLTRRFSTAGAGLAAALLLAGAAGMAGTAWRFGSLTRDPTLDFQRSFTAAMLAATPRDEPVGVIWDVCGGFMFNEPTQYYWTVLPIVSRVVERQTGTDPFGEPLVAALERQQVRFVIGRREVALQSLPAVTRDYLQQHYTSSGCVWTRRR